MGYGYAARGELENAGADAVAPDLAALREMLLSKNRLPSDGQITMRCFAR